MGGDFLTPDQLSARWGGCVTPSTLKMWRYRKKGPPYLKVGAKVLYRTAAIVVWETENEVAAKF